MDADASVSTDGRVDASDQHAANVVGGSEDVVCTRVLKAEREAVEDKHCHAALAGDNVTAGVCMTYLKELQAHIEAAPCSCYCYAIYISVLSQPYTRIILYRRTSFPTVHTTISTHEP